MGIDEEEEEDLTTKVNHSVRDKLKVTIKTDDIKDVGRMGKW